MKKYLAAFMAVLLSLAVSLPAFAAGWEQMQSGEWMYYNSDGSALADAWVQSAGAWYYMGPDAVMMTENYTPDGYWVNAQGVYEPQWGRRTDAVSPYVNQPYGGIYSYSFYKDVYGDGVEHWSITESYGGKVLSTYELYEQSPFSYEIMDIYSGHSMGYVSISPDRNIAYVTMGGQTQRCYAAQ